MSQEGTAATKIPMKTLMACHGFAILMGASALGFGVWQAWRGWAAKSWPTTHGVITRSETALQFGGTEADIRYRYSWGGSSHTGDRVHAGMATLTESGADAREQVSKYPVGATVQVSVDPNHPETSMLEPGVGWSAVFLSGLGLLFILVPMLMMWAALHAQKYLLRRESAKAFPPPEPGAGWSAFRFSRLKNPDAGADTEGVDWTPLEQASAATFRSSCLRASTQGTLRVVPSIGQWVFASVFGLVGLGVVLGFGHALLDDWHAAQSNFDRFFALVKIIPVLIGCAFLFFMYLMVGPRRVVFDLQAQACRHLSAGINLFSKNPEVPFSAIRGLQLLLHDVPTSSDGSGGYNDNLQLNLVLKDGRRFNLMGHCDRKSIESDARTLAEALRVPLWVRA